MKVWSILLLVALCALAAVQALELACELPKSSGPCKAAFQRYHYNNRNGKCEKFIYGGCRGNENNFETKEACEAKCKNQPVDD